MTPLATDDWANIIMRCEPLAYTDFATYRDASVHAAETVPPSWNKSVESATAPMERAITIRNQYYRDRVNDWRVVHG